MLKVWGRKTSSNVQAVMWSVGELGLAYERYDVGHRFGGLDTPEYLAMNPNATIPVVRDGDGEPLWESAAILRYLANRYGRAPYWPDDLAMRTQIDKWAEWSKINVALNFSGPIFWRVVRTPPRRRDANAIREAIRFLDFYLDIAEKQLTNGSYLCRDDFTPADVQFGHLLYRYFDLAPARPPESAGGPTGVHATVLRGPACARHRRTRPVASAGAANRLSPSPQPSPRSRGARGNLTAARSRSCRRRPSSRRTRRSRRSCDRRSCRRICRR